MDDGAAVRARKFAEFLSNQGWIGQGILNKDWSQTSIGPIEDWPEALRATLRFVLTTRQSINFFWGPDLHQFFNAAYAPTLQGMPGEPIGAPFKAFWSEVFEGVRPYFERAMAGESSGEDDLPLALTRGGVTEQTCWTFSYSPLFDDAGEIAGFLNIVNETTRGVTTRQALESAQGALAAEREQLKQMFEQAPTFMALLSGPEHRLDRINPGYLRLVGHRPLLGLPVAEALPDAAAQGFVALLDTVFRTGKAFNGTGVLYAVQEEPGGPVRERYADFVYQPLRDAEGNVSGIFVEGIDVTERVTGGEALRQSEERLRLIVEGARDYAIITIDAEHRVTGWSAGAEEIFGETQGVMAGRPIADIFTPEDRAAGAPEKEVATAASQGVATDERWHRRLDGRRVHLSGTMRPLPRDASGEPQGFIKIARNTTAERLAADRQAALLRLGDALRDRDDIGAIAFAGAEAMAELLGATRTGYGVVDARAETVAMQPDWRDSGAGSLAGIHHFRDYGLFIDELKRNKTVIVEDVTTDPRTRDNAEVLIGMGVRVLVNLPIFDRGEFTAVMFLHFDRPRGFSGEELAFLRTVADRTQAAVAKVRAEEQRALLNGEMSHRLKNTLALVQAIAAQTLKSVSDRSAVQAFNSRIAALSGAHDLLLQEDWAAARMMTVVRGALASHGDPAQFRIEGPDLMVGSKAALSLSLILHELATNALKYGALTVSGGRVRIQWTVEDTAAGPEIVLQWKERGGPAAAEPSRTGFGSRLVQTGLVGTGSVTRTFAQTGLEVEFRAPLDQFQA